MHEIDNDEILSKKNVNIKGAVSIIQQYLMQRHCRDKEQSILISRSDER